MILTGLDLETTGLLDGDHRIIEIAMLKYDERGNRLDRYVARLNPQRPIEAGATAVHGITFEMVAHELTFEERVDSIQTYLKDTDLLIAHNGRGFDLPFVKKEMARVGTAMSPVRHIDTMLEGRWATPNGKVPNLEELCFATGVPYDRNAAHAAEYDVERMMDSFFKGVRKGFFKLEGEVFQ